MQEPPVPLRRLLAFGGPVVGASYTLFFVQFYLLKYATDVLFLAPAAVGTLFALGKLWDAVSDPLVGSWSDRSRFRLGRRRPFLWASLPLLVLGFAMLFDPPESLGKGALLAWTGVGLFVYYTAYTLFALPHAAMGAELSRDSHQRTRLFAARQISFIVGMLFAFGAMQVAMNAEAARASTGALALATGVAAALVLAIVPLTVREPQTPGHRGGDGLRASLRDVWRNPPAKRLLAVYFVEHVGVGAVGAMTPFVAEYVLRRPEVVGFLPAVYVLSSVLAIPLWVRLSRSLGKQATWIRSMLLAAAAFGGMLFVGEGDVALVTVLLVVAGAAMGSGGVLANSILADVIDLDEAATGQRKEGVYSAAMNFVLKVGIALATALGGWLLGATGFEPGAVQGEGPLVAIRVLFAGLPCAGFLLGALIFRGFRIGTPAPAPVSAG